MHKPHPHFKPPARYDHRRRRAVGPFTIESETALGTTGGPSALHAGQTTRTLGGCVHGADTPADQDSAYSYILGSRARRDHRQRAVSASGATSPYEAINTGA